MNVRLFSKCVTFWLSLPTPQKIGNWYCFCPTEVLFLPHRGHWGLHFTARFYSLQGTPSRLSINVPTWKAGATSAWIMEVLKDRDGHAPRLPTCNSLIATQELAGKPCSMGTRNWRQPDQWPMSSIMQIRLNIRMKTLAIFKNCNNNSVLVGTYNKKSISTVKLWRGKVQRFPGHGKIQQNFTQEASAGLPIYCRSSILC